MWNFLPIRSLLDMQRRETVQQIGAKALRLYEDDRPDLAKQRSIRSPGSSSSRRHRTDPGSRDRFPQRFDRVLRLVERTAVTQHHQDAVFLWVHAERHASAMAEIDELRADLRAMEVAAKGYHDLDEASRAEIETLREERDEWKREALSIVEYREALKPPDTMEWQEAWERQQQRADDLQAEVERLREGMAMLYNDGYAPAVAKLCDEHLDRSGGLLSEIRIAAANLRHG
jgi:hypothetical protein